MGTTSVRCSYRLDQKPEYKNFLEKIKDRKVVFASGSTTNPFIKLGYMVSSKVPEATDLSGIMMFLLYKSNIIT